MRRLLLTFPLTAPGASESLVRMYISTRRGNTAAPSAFIQLGTTSIWDGCTGITLFYDRHSEFTGTGFANAEVELLALSPSVAPTTVLIFVELPTVPSSLPLATGQPAPDLDLARAILAVHFDFAENADDLRPSADVYVRQHRRQGNGEQPIEVRAGGGGRGGACVYSFDRKQNVFYSSAPAPRAHPIRTTNGIRMRCGRERALEKCWSQSEETGGRGRGEEKVMIAGAAVVGLPDTRTPPVVPVSAPSTSAAVRGGGETERGRPGVRVKTVRLCADDNEDLQPPSPATTTCGRARTSPRPTACAVPERRVRQGTSHLGSGSSTAFALALALPLSLPPPPPPPPPHPASSSAPSSSPAVLIPVPVLIPVRVPTSAPNSPDSHPHIPHPPRPPPLLSPLVLPVRPEPGPGHASVHLVGAVPITIGNIPPVPWMLGRRSL
ncbi:hypothetical protein DFH08DRAFT_1012967 [Mycena albidolilacea]|uniref:Uncharacterized protein n=1 Tax=Mycena albidolilacea TaxID=1033008 RepID=A0AAD6ZV15_9AGAR|nr:hypothetical protein DFH08DRAFT_1012967 [Mycena albidolilacea]